MLEVPRHFLCRILTPTAKPSLVLARSPLHPARTHAHHCKARAYPDGTSIGGMGKNSIARNHSLPGVA
jgi:hypothetical protein